MNHKSTSMSMPSIRSGLWSLLAALGFIAANLACVDAAQKPVRMRVGTIAPVGSIYYNQLAQLGQQWQNAPETPIRLNIIGGVAASESELVRMIRLGNIDGAMLTGVGLAEAHPAVSGLQVSPMMFRSFDELEFVSRKLRPTLDTGLREKGLVVLFWADAGWVRFFSREPLRHPDDLRRMKVFAWAGDPHQLDVMRRAGFHPVALETSDIMLGFNRRLIDAASLAPPYVLAIQADRHAEHMLDLNWAPLLGAMVLSEKSWERLPEKTRQFMLVSAENSGRELTAAARKASDDAVAAMQKRGLKVHGVTPELEEAWREAAEAIYPGMRGKMVPAGIFDEVQRLIEEYRRQESPTHP
jgi:TRAP-type transport system periplasmic protein